MFPLFWSDERLWNWDLEIRDVYRTLRYEVDEIGRVKSVGDTVVLQTLKHKHTLKYTYYFYLCVDAQPCTERLKQWQQSRRPSYEDTVCL